jgi:hypothetical protein
VMPIPDDRMYECCAFLGLFGYFGLL